MNKNLEFYRFISFLCFVFWILCLSRKCIRDDGNAYIEFFPLRTQFLQAATFAAF